MFERSVSPDTVRRIVESGDRIASYPEDKPNPSALVLGFEKGEPVHIVVARSGDSGECTVVTVYTPGRAIWNDDFRTRREP